MKYVLLTGNLLIKSIKEQPWPKINTETVGTLFWKLHLSLKSLYDANIFPFSLSLAKCFSFLGEVNGKENLII